MHYDHAGMLHRYPGARFHLQASEMAYATGLCICGGPRRRGYELEDVVYPVRCVNADRVTFHDQTVEITSGLSVHRIGCHTAGQQVARV
jgi:glyoxylase-like metal-dependent hydrolase (beta-lactamase superfamily II)